jgi:glycosyltransferase involved in cell wall biosynthesis
MEHTTRVTVAICTWNRADVLGRTLQHMTTMRPPADCAWEVLVVDNNSTDHTTALAQGFAGRLPIRVAREERPGVTFARNRSITEASGDLLVWTDDDVLVQADWLSRFVGGIQTWDADFAFGRALPCWDGAAPSWFDWNRHAGKFAFLDYGSEPFVADTGETPFYTLNAGGRLSAIRALGGFRNELSERVGRLHCGEDVDLYDRALANGCKIVYLPDAVVQHIIPPARAQKAFYRKQLHDTISVNLDGIRDRFRNLPWVFGLPRFFYKKAILDAAALCVAAAKGNQGETFYRELEVRRFGELWLEARRTAQGESGAGGRAVTGKTGAS